MGLPVGVTATGGIGEDIFDGDTRFGLQCTSIKMECDEYGALTADTISCHIRPTVVIMTQGYVRD